MKGAVANYEIYLEQNEIKLEKIKESKEKVEEVFTTEIKGNFNYIPTPKFSLLEVFMKMRELLDYDRKLKNAYLKSIKDIFEEYGFEIELKIDKNITIESVISMKVTHLKNLKKEKIINIDRHSKELCNLLKELLKYKG